MTMRTFNRVLVALLVIMATFGCSKNKVPAAKENVEQALKQSGFTDVNVDEVIEKPFLLEQLQQKIRTTLTRTQDAGHENVTN